jgi:hypothetical protein
MFLCNKNVSVLNSFLMVTFGHLCTIQISNITLNFFFCKGYNTVNRVLITVAYLSLPFLKSLNPYKHMGLGICAEGIGKVVPVFSITSWRCIEEWSYSSTLS